MTEISILELNELKNKETSLVVLYYQKDNLISKLACINLDKLQDELNLNIYKLQLENDNFDEPLPIISIFSKGVIKTRLFGFHNLSKTREFLQNNSNIA